MPGFNIDFRLLFALLLLVTVLFVSAFFLSQQVRQQLPQQQATGSLNAILITPRGVQIKAEIADTPLQYVQGLMFREGLCENCGMLFILPAPTIPSFWMKNMNFPIDIIFLDEGMRVVHVFENVPPCESEPCPRYSPRNVSSYVLELPASSAKKYGLAENMSLKRQ